MPGATAIALRSYPYSDTHKIVAFYTREWGPVSAKLPLRSNRTEAWCKLPAPLRILQIQCPRPPKSGFVNLNDVSLIGGLQEGTTSPIKAGIAALVCEVAEQLVHKHPQDEALFHFLYRTALLLGELPSGGEANFHIAFLVELLRVLGHMPPQDQLIIPLDKGFDLETLQPAGLSSRFVVPPQEARFIPLISRITYGNMGHFLLNRRQRNRITEHLLSFCRAQDTGIEHLRCLPVLQQLFI